LFFFGWTWRTPCTGTAEQDEFFAPIPEIFEVRFSYVFDPLVYHCRTAAIVNVSCARMGISFNGLEGLDPREPGPKRHSSCARKKIDPDDEGNSSQRISQTSQRHFAIEALRISWRN
jgi:hypothetical protein